MPTNTPKPRTPYTCLRPVRRGGHPPIGRLPHSWTTLPEPAVARAPPGPPRCRHRAPRPPHSPPARPRRRRRRYGDPRGPWRAGGTRCRETGGTLSALGQGRAAVPCPGEGPATETPRCLCELLWRKPSRVGAAETRGSRHGGGQATKASPHEGGQGRRCPHPGRQRPCGPDLHLPSEREQEEGADTSVGPLSALYCACGVRSVYWWTAHSRSCGGVHAGCGDSGSRIANRSSLGSTRAQGASGLEHLTLSR